jgi:hypothetical protein
MAKNVDKSFSVDVNTGETKWWVNLDLGSKITHCVNFEKLR